MYGRCQIFTAHHDISNIYNNPVWGELFIRYILKFLFENLRAHYSKRCHVGMSQTVIFMIIRLVTLSVNIFLM
jgi:hypothetical protein